MAADIEGKKAQRAEAEASGNTALVNEINYYLGEVSWKYEEIKKQLEAASSAEGLTNTYVQQITLGEQYKKLCELREKVEELQGAGSDSSHMLCSCKPFTLACGHSVCPSEKWE